MCDIVQIIESDQIMKLIYGKYPLELVNSRTTSKSISLPLDFSVL